MGIISTEVEIIPSGKNIQYYKDKGYNVKYHKPLTVKIDDLSNGSHVYINVECDICKNVSTVKYKDYNKIMSRSNYYCCSKCSWEKAKETIIDKYNCDNVMQNKEIHLKQVNSLMKNYGVTTPLKNKEIKQKVENTMLKNWGATCSFLSEDLRAKIERSCHEKYGYSIPSQSPEIKVKVAQTFYKNGTTATSKQQIYIYNLYSKNSDVELNFPIKYYNADLCFTKENLVFEVDFGGHDLSVKLGSLTQEEFNKKEIIRNNIIKREGYKMIRLISSHDKLPSDEVLLQILENSRQYFKKYENHSWIEWNIDTSTVRNAEQKDGVFFNYGELRNIKKEDIKEVA